MNNESSPFAPNDFPFLPPINGVQMSATESGMRYKDRLDLVMLEFSPNTIDILIHNAGVLPTSRQTSPQGFELCFLYFLIDRAFFYL